MKKILTVCFVLLFIGFSELFSDAEANWAIRISSDISYNEGHAMAMDKFSNLFIIGNFNANTVYLGGSNSITKNGEADAYLAKYDSNGVFQWVSLIGGADYEEAIDLVVDDDGNIYVTGNFNSINLDFGNGIELNKNSSDNIAIFVVKYNNNGGVLWAKSFENDDEYNNFFVFGIALNKSGNIYLAGIFGEDINEDATIAMKLDNSGTLQKSYKYTGTDFDIGVAYYIAANSSGDVYFSSYDYETQAELLFKVDNLDNWILCDELEDKYINTIKLDENGILYAALTTSSGSTDVTKYDEFGNKELFTTIIDDLFVNIYDIDFDSEGNIYFCGVFGGDIIYFNNGHSGTNYGFNNAFIAKYNSLGECQWAELQNGEYFIYSYSIAVSNTNKVYLMGNFNSENVDFHNGISLQNYSGFSYIFLAQYLQGSGIPIVVGPVKTSAVTDVTAISGGELVDDGGLSIVEMGICISESRYPTTSDTRIPADNTNTGIFTVKIEDLSPQTKYYVRTYVMTNSNSFYGTERTFTTAPGIPTD